MENTELLSIVRTKINKEKGFARSNKKMQTDFFESYFFYKHITRMILNTFEQDKNEEI